MPSTPCTSPSGSASARGPASARATPSTRGGCGRTVDRSKRPKPPPASRRSRRTTGLLPALLDRLQLVPLVASQPAESGDLESVLLEYGRGTRGSASAVSSREDGLVLRQFAEALLELGDGNVDVALVAAGLLDLLRLADVEEEGARVGHDAIDVSSLDAAVFAHDGHLGDLLLLLRGQPRRRGRGRLLPLHAQGRCQQQQRDDGMFHGYLRDRYSSRQMKVWILLALAAALGLRSPAPPHDPARSDAIAFAVHPIDTG